jgi:hypothetical protein
MSEVESSLQEIGHSKKEEFENNPSSLERVLSEIAAVLDKEPTWERFIAERLELLASNSVKREIYPFSQGLADGYLTPDSAVYRTILVDPFQVDDPEIYRVLLETMKEFRGIPANQAAPVRQLVGNSVQYTLGRYFSNFVSTEHTETQNQEFYCDHSTCDSDNVHLSELRGKGIAVCAEKAAAAQNVLVFLGYDMKIAVGRCELGVDSDEMHMYNLVKTEKGTALYDPTNPSVVFTPEGNVNSVLPAMYKLTDQQLADWEEGGPIEVEHLDYELADGIPVAKVRTIRTYRKNTAKSSWV